MSGNNSHSTLEEWSALSMRTWEERFAVSDLLTPVELEARLELHRLIRRSRATRWLESAARLLAEPEPGRTPFAIEGLIVEGAITGLLGPAKTGKTWLVLELATGIVTGRPALDRFTIPKAGPVMLVLEESGRQALHRRLGMLVRGRALDPAALAELHFAANLRVRLNDLEWQKRLLAAGQELRPRAIILDPLARLKGAAVDENVQREIGPVLDFMRDLRDATGAAVVFVHHTGHEGGRMRGSSDLEAYWESKIVVHRDDGVCRLSAEHREAEATPEISYRLGFDADTASVRLSEIASEERAQEPLGDRIQAELGKTPAMTTEEIRAAVKARKEDVIEALKTDGRFELTGRRPDVNANAHCWTLVEEPFPFAGNDWEQLPPAHPSSAVPRGDGPPVGGPPRERLEGRAVPGEPEGRELEL